MFTVTGGWLYSVGGGGLGEMVAHGIWTVQWNLDLTNFYYNKVLGITNDILYPNNSKICEKEPRRNKTSL